MNSSVDNLFTLFSHVPFFHMFSWTLYYWQKNSTDTSLRIWKRFYPCNTYTVPSNKKNILYKYIPHIHSSYIFKQHRSLWVKINNIWLEYYKISFKKWQILKQKSELGVCNHVRLFCSREMNDVDRVRSITRG